MLLINSEIANMGTRTDLAIFEAMRYKEICIQGVHNEPSSIALAVPSQALEYPIAAYWHERAQISAEWDRTMYINHYIKFYHPYAKHPLLIVVNQNLTVVMVTSAGNEFASVIPNITKLGSIKLPEVMDAIYKKFPTVPIREAIDLKMVLHRHTFQNEMVHFQ